MVKDKLYFDPIMHKYYIDVNEVPSVTAIIPKQDFGSVNKEVLENARLEGKAEHQLVEMFFNTYGTTFGDERLIALQEFLDEHKSMTGKFVFSERPVFSREHNFAGTPDAVFEKCIIDVKRSAGNKKIRALQQAGYMKLLKENDIIPATKKWLVLIYDGTKWKAENVYQPDAQAMFMTCLSIFKANQVVKNYIK